MNKLTSITAIFSLIFLLALPIESIAENLTTKEFFPDIGSKINPITITYKEILYPDELWFSEIKNNNVHLSEDERFIIDVVEKNQNGTPEEVLDLFHPEDRKAKRDTIIDPKIFKRNQNYFKYVKDTRFITKIFYGDYRIIFIEHDHDIIGKMKTYFTVFKKGENFYLSGRLSDDPALLYFVNKLKATY